MLAQALTTATAIRDDSARARALTGLAPHLPPNQQPAVLAQAFTAAAAIPSDYTRAHALTALAPHLSPDLLGQALEAAPKASPETLTALLQRSRSVLAPDENAAYVNLLREGINGTDRIVCSDLLTAVAPDVAEIGGMHAVEQCVHAVIDVHRWWP